MTPSNTLGPKIDLNKIDSEAWRRVPITDPIDILIMDVRQRLVGFWGGDCHTATKEILRIYANPAAFPQIVRGSNWREGNHNDEHYWVVCPSEVLDVTAAQFYKKITNTKNSTRNIHLIPYALRIGIVTGRFYRGGTVDLHEEFLEWAFGSKRPVELQDEEET